GAFSKLDQQCGGLIACLERFFCNQPLDPAFLHLDDDAKNDLLTRGKADFTIWAKRLDGPNGPMWARLEPNDDPTVRLKVKVKAPIMTGLRAGSESSPKRVWKDHFRFPETRGQWAEARNALTHLRSPLNDFLVQLGDDIMTIYLPRIIEI